MIKTLGSIELECEYLVSQIIQGTLFPSEYINLCCDMSDTPFIDFIAEIYELQLEIQKRIVTKFGLLKDKEVEKFISGKNTELLELFSIVKARIDKVIPQYEQGLQEAFMDAYQEMEANMEGQDFVGMSEAVAVASSKTMFLDILRESRDSLMKASAHLRNIISMYGEVQTKARKEKVKVGNNVPYKLFLQSLISNPDVFSSNPQATFCLGNVINALVNALPNTPVLDPFKEDESKCILKALCHPEDYYSYCERGDIVSAGVGKVFGDCYPEHYKKFINMYLEDYDTMPYQKQLQFRKCFGLVEDNAQIMELVSQSLQLAPSQEKV